MSTALYFPHTRCRDKNVLKSALFLFDDLECIVPWENFQHDDKDLDFETREAIDLILRDIVPEKKEQTDAHLEIERVCEGSMIKRLGFPLLNKRDKYLIFPDKFEYRTWDLLEDKGLVRQLGRNYDYDYFMSSSLGQFMMAMLALACSGGRKQLVTNYPDAYKSLYLASADDFVSNIELENKIQHRLLNIRIKGFDFRKVRFSKLLDLRKKDNSTLVELRNNYLETHKKCIAEVQEVSGNFREVEKCINKYTIDAERGLKELKRALRIHTSTTLLSKTVISAVAGMATEAFVPSSGFLTSGAVLSGQLISYKDKRRELLKKHKFAWLYETYGPRLKL